MYVVDPRREADHPTALDRNGDMVPGIGEEFCRQLLVRRIIEYVWRGVHEQGFVAASQNPDLHRHSILLPPPLPCRQHRRD